MKALKPPIAFLLLLTILSITVGLAFPIEVVNFTYSPTVYLLICVAQAAHLIEENYTKAWEVEAQIRKTPDGTSKEPESGRDFLVAFSHVLVLLSFLFYFPIAVQAPWAIIYGIGISVLGVGNGVAHTVILAKFRKNTGFVSGLFLFIFGILLWLSIVIPLGI